MCMQMRTAARHLSLPAAISADPFHPSDLLVLFVQTARGDNWCCGRIRLPTGGRPG